MIHAAEGLDQAAREELDRFDRLGCLSSNTVFIHGVAFCRAAADRIIDAGAGLVWCPSSNQFLFEQTAGRAAHLMTPIDWRSAATRD
jgi:cytosine/adenosine deaminase-related metal-dependent hydrolase